MGQARVISSESSMTSRSASSYYSFTRGPKISQERLLSLHFFFWSPMVAEFVNMHTLFPVLTEQQERTARPFAFSPGYRIVLMKAARRGPYETARSRTKREGAGGGCRFREGQHNNLQTRERATTRPTPQPALYTFNSTLCTCLHVDDLPHVVLVS